MIYKRINPSNLIRSNEFLNKIVHGTVAGSSGSGSADTRSLTAFSSTPTTTSTSTTSTSTTTSTSATTSASTTSASTTSASTTSASTTSSSTPLPIDTHKFYRKLNNELRKYHHLMPLEHEPDIPDTPRSILSHERDVELSKFYIYLQTILNTVASMETAFEKTDNIEKCLVRKYTSKPLPKFPNHWSEEILISYLKSLTSCHHQNEKYSSPNGLISAITNDLLRVNNPATMSHLSTEAFNLGISYHARNRDLRGARQLFRDMMSSGIPVNTDTYNILLLACKYPLDNVKSNWSIHPLRTIDGYLRQMRSRGIPLNIDTWNILLSTIPEGSNKAKILTEMSKKNIPVSRRALANCVDDILKQIGPRLTMVYLDKQLSGYNIGIDSVNTVISGLLKKYRPGVAWKYLHYAISKWNLTPTTSVLNTFGKQFAKNGDIKLFIGVYTTMVSNPKWNIKPSCVTYEYMLAAAVRSKHHKYKYELIEVLHSISSRVPRTKQYHNWLLRAKSQFQYLLSHNVSLSKKTFTLEKVITPQATLLWEQAQHVLKWNEPQHESYRTYNINKAVVWPESHVSKLLNLYPDFDPIYKELSNKRTFYSKLTRQFRTERAVKEETLKHELVSKGPYKKYVDDLAREGLIE